MAEFKLREGRPLNYTQDDKITKTFHVRYDKKLSPVAKLVLNTLHNKYFYYAIEDISSFLKSKPAERDKILAILYSPVISLQNDFSISFFDIWIQEIYISETSKFNKFLSKENLNLKSFNYITIKFFYATKPPATKPKTLW